jgi:hypothetical protein
MMHGLATRCFAERPAARWPQTGAPLSTFLGKDYIVPRIKRWFPVSHDINSDPEVIELTDKFGLTGLKVWLEILSIADRNDGVVGNNIESLSRALAVKVSSKTSRVLLVLLWITTRQWLDNNSTIRVRNYLKYHRTAEPKSLPSEPDRTRPEPDLKIKNPDPAPSVDSPIKDKEASKVRTLDPRIKEIADRIFNSNKPKFLRLIVWVKQAQKHNFEDQVIVAALERFEPYCAEIEQWYPYLDKLIYKADQDINRDRHDAKHAAYKEEVREASKLFAIKGAVKDA